MNEFISQRTDLRSQV